MRRRHFGDSPTFRPRPRFLESQNIESSCGLLPLLFHHERRTRCWGASTANKATMPATYAIPDLFPCGQCGRRFSRREHLERHTRTRSCSQVPKGQKVAKPNANTKFEQILRKSLSHAQCVGRVMRGEMSMSVIIRFMVTP